VKAIRYTTDALRNLKRHGNMAARIRRAVEQYAADPMAHANNVTKLVGSSSSRMRVGDYRVIFVETEAELSVVRVGPRGGVYDEGTQTMTIQTTISPDGQRLVTMSAEDYQDLIDARDAEAAMRAVAAGTLQTLSGADVDAYLAAATPLAFWRKHRGFAQVELARQIGVSQPYLAQLENGQRAGSVAVYRRLAKQLGLTVDELLPDEPAD
jgi:DNA-binding XRE family transcriptional regulator/mRNA-degrading endonuclease RelE of RelBE toxin-antitoxin system